jgi:pentatricopeptide repeat protein
LQLQAQCTNHMHLPTALELVHEMRQRNVSPNTHTYSSMLNVCVKAGELDLALDVFNQVGRAEAVYAVYVVVVGRCLMMGAGRAAARPAYA